MKENSTKRKVAKRFELDEIDPLDDLDVKRLKLVARGRGWSTKPEQGKRRARALIASRAEPREKHKRPA